MEPIIEDGDQLDGHSLDLSRFFGALLEGRRRSSPRPRAGDREFVLKCPECGTPLIFSRYPSDQGAVFYSAGLWHKAASHHPRGENRGHAHQQVETGK